MFESLDALFRPTFAIAAVMYLVLAIRVSRASGQHSNRIIGLFLLLVGALVAGSAFSYGTQDPTIFGIGRVLSYCAAAFVPVAFYAVYREYTNGAPHPIVIVMLSIIPVATTVLALTNSMHNMIWTMVETESGIRFSNATDHYWFNHVHAPYAYGLFAYSVIALAARLPTIAPAHRNTVMLLLVCGVLPFAASLGNNYLGFGPPELPVTSLSLVVLLPLYFYASVSLRFYEFSPFGYKNLFDHVRDPIIVLDASEAIVCTNKSAQAFLGASEKDLLGHRLWEDFPKARALLKKANELDLTQTLRLDNDNIYELSVRPLLGPRGQGLGMVVVCRDVTERRNALDKLADNEHLIRTLIETSSNGILRFALDTNDPEHKYRCIFANRAAELYLGSSSGTLVGMPLEKLPQLEPERIAGHFAKHTDKRGALNFEVSAESADGQNWLRIVAEPVGEDLSVTLIDITQRKHNEHKMLADALRDPLTSVLNRRGFEKEGATSIRSSDKGAVLYLDLNHFKSINDRFGHQAGDALLKAFGHRLEFCLRPEDVLGRLGGDEFAIVLPGVEVADAKHVAERLVQTASEAYIIQGQEIQCTASVGIALMPRHGTELWHLVSTADQAMYRAKSISAEEAANDRGAYIEAATAS